MTSHTQKTENLHAVLGATGSLGINIVFELVNNGKQVVAVARNKKKAEEIFKDHDVIIRQADLMNLDELKDAIKGTSFVYHCGGLSYEKWLKFFPVMNTNILDAVKGEKAVLIYADNLYMYGKMQNSKINEGHPISKESKKGYLRHILANEILESHKKGEIQAVIARSGDFYGPNVTNGFVKPLFYNPIHDKSASWLIDSSQSHSLIFIKDMAKAMIKLAINPDTYGSIWHIPGDKAITGANFTRLIGSELGKEVKIKVLSLAMIKILSLFVPIVKELKELQFQWKYPFIIDGIKFKTRFPNYQATNHEEAITETITWFKSQE